MKKRNNDHKITDASEVSAVVCAKNAASTIEECLQSIQNNNPKEIILVDAHSTDDTRKIAEPYTTKIVEDPGLGLAMARNYGIQHAKGKFVCNVGPDNVVPADTFSQCIDYMKKHNHVGVSTQTFIKDAENSYLSTALNIYKKARYYPGQRSVIGTPHLYKTEVLKKYKFDNKMTWSDDSDLCLRLSKDNYTFGIADTFVYEIGMETVNSIVARWKNYGRSDFEYYSKYANKWGIQRKIHSLLHPFKSELLFPLLSKRLTIAEKTKALPFLLFITFIRYQSWMYLLGHKKKENEK